MGDLEVTAGVIADASVEVGNAADDISEVVSALAHDVEVTVDEWVGAAASAFTAAWSDWKGAANTIVEALHQSAELLDASGRGYVTADSAAAAIVGATALRL